ncbi:MAG: MgtC/SapB family protein, partial [Pirellulales bacterium]|nr:MgtC/SapB family protein [Pirellulales bacterium]
MEPAFQQLAVAALLGLLVGLQREHAASGIAGMRTFPLITLLGTLSAMLAEHFGNGWIIAAGLLSVTGITAVGHFRRREKGTGPICRNGPEGAAHKLDLSPF